MKKKEKEWLWDYRELISVIVFANAIIMEAGIRAVLVVHHVT